MIETSSFPEPEEDTFQIIHSKRRVTCIYQVEQDHCLVAASPALQQTLDDVKILIAISYCAQVYALPPSPIAAKAPTTKYSKPTSETRTATVTDEQYRTSLARACDRYLVSRHPHVSLLTRLSSSSCLSRSDE